MHSRCRAARSTASSPREAPPQGTRRRGCWTHSRHGGPAAASSPTCGPAPGHAAVRLLSPGRARGSGLLLSRGRRLLDGMATVKIWERSSLAAREIWESSRPVGEDSGERVEHTHEFGESIEREWMKCGSGEIWGRQRERAGIRELGFCRAGGLPEEKITRESDRTMGLHVCRQMV